MKIFYIEFRWNIYEAKGIIPWMIISLTQNMHICKMVSIRFMCNEELLVFLMTPHFFYLKLCKKNTVTQKSGRIMCPIFPTLIQRNVCESKHHSKLSSFKHFHEYFHNYFICGTMSQVNSLCIYVISNQMILCVDVHGSIMEFGIFSQLDYKSIVNQKRSSIHLFLL